MKSYERPYRFAFLDEPFTQENQLLTPKMSLKRPNIVNKYKDLIAEVYSGKRGQQLAISGKISDLPDTSA